MTLATLSQVLQPALEEGFAVAGLVVLGWEDARAYTEAAEDAGVPVILQAGPGCRAHTPLPVLAAMFTTLAEQATVPVVTHLDHGTLLDECREAIHHGFTSVMYDGSRKPLGQNIEETAAVAELAHKSGVSCEGEIGFVGYAESEASSRTLPEDAARFERETGVDAMAISIGNVHLQKSTAARIDLDALAAIEAVTSIPLVLHGGSGIPGDMRHHLAHKTSVCKFNMGTELRQTFGSALRAKLTDDPDVFDRISILKATEAPVAEAAKRIFDTFRK